MSDRGLLSAYHAVHEVGLDQVGVGQLIPTILRNLDTGLCRRGHHAKLGIDVFLLLSIRESVPDGSSSQFLNIFVNVQHKDE